MVSNRKALCLLFAAVIFLCFGCGGTPNRPRGDVEPEVVKSPWQKTEISKVTNGGLLSTNVAAVPDQLAENLVHFVFLVDAHEATEQEPNPPIEYTLKHLVWNTASAEIISQSDIVTLDNTLEFALTADSNNNLYLAYRGGNVAHCNTHQSDTMLSVKYAGSNNWTEYTGAIGYSGSRNPAYTDGDAGDFPSLAVDDNGNVHIAFQFFWEGCDSNNTLHPDVLYVQKGQGMFDSFAIGDEEQVEGNNYTSNYQNAVGYFNSLVLDSEGNPVVFHGAREINYTEYGLRFSRRLEGVWRSEWLDSGCFIGDISAAVSPQGTLAVAYYVDDCTVHLSYTEDDEKSLRYAYLDEEGWHKTIVDEATKVGTHTRLAFDSSGNPAIAYYETESYGIGKQRDLYNLKLARWDAENNRWFKQRVDETGDIGVYNSLWFDGEDKIFLSSFSNTDNTIYLFSEAAE
ncbi:hypothetical protein SAMN02745866_04063 [Alteromonadaceae bacterium Bs31]|nr:hypothetical protein SAMN02745866_04063 [Alteromonadaceae bacterium Bs31]